MPPCPILQMGTHEAALLDLALGARDEPVKSLQHLIAIYHVENVDRPGPAHDLSAGEFDVDVHAAAQILLAEGLTSALAGVEDPGHVLAAHDPGAPLIFLHECERQRAG